MRALIGTAAALGILLIFNGITSPQRTVSGSTSSALARLTSEAAWPGINATRLAAICLLLAWLAAIAAVAATGSVVIAGVGASVAAMSPLSAARKRRERRRRSMAETWPDALSSIIAGIRAGMALPECCRALAVTGPQELRPAFASFSSTYVASGSFEAALCRLRDELQEPVGDRVVAVLLMTHQVGGNDIVRVLRTTAEMVREDCRIRGEIQARWSWTMAAAKVAASAPFIVLMLMGLRPEGAAAYSSPTGITTVGVGLAATWLGYRLMLRAAKLPDDKRLSS